MGRFDRNMFDRNDDFTDWFDQSPPVPRPGMWTTRDGRELFIGDMSMSHLVNTMAYLWRVGTLQQLADDGKVPEYYQLKIWELSAELQRRARARKEALHRGVVAG